MTPDIGLYTPWDPADLARGVRARRDAGLDFVSVSDHVTFHDGTGRDGLLTSAASLAVAPDLPVVVAAYLLPLRHPSHVARQLADLHAMAPGMVTLAIGVGGDDRREVEACGVDPATRGARTDEMIDVLHRLQTGRPVTHHGEHIDLAEVTIRPAVEPATPLLVAGRSDRTFERAARVGTGWFGIYCSADRFADGVHRVEARAAELGRSDVDWRHGLHLWCGVDDRDPARARDVIAGQMRSFYRIDYNRFERYAPAGTSEHVAEFVARYVRAGARTVSLTVAGHDDAASVESAAAIRSHLRAEFA